MLKILELFAGIGACSSALDRLGIEHEIADAVEIDKYAMASFNAIHDTNFEPQDILTWDKQLDVDLIMHGSPCQDFSIAGRQAGGDENSGTRSSLMYETVRIIDKLKPKYVIWENVKNLLSQKHRHNFDNYLERMESMGYKNYYQVLNAKDYGIPQNRERVFTISIRNDIEKEFIFPAKQELKLRLKDMLEQQVDEKYYLSDKMCRYITSEDYKYKVNKDLLVVNRDIACSKTTREGNTRADTSDYIIQSENKTNIKLEQVIRDGGLYGDKQAGSIYNKEGLCPTITTEASANWNILINEKSGLKQVGELDIKGQDSIKRVYSSEGISPTLTNMQGENRQPKILETPFIVASRGRNPENPSSREVGIHTEQRLEPNTKGLCNTITSVQKDNYVVTIGNYMPSNHEASRIVDSEFIAPTVKENHGTVTATNTNDLRIRKLTPKECWRLMGFNDEEFEKAEKVNSNTQLYKQAGNSIVVNVLEKILKNLLEAEND